SSTFGRDRGFASGLGRGLAGAVFLPAAAALAFRRSPAHYQSKPAAGSAVANAFETIVGGDGRGDAGVYARRSGRAFRKLRSEQRSGEHRLGPHTRPRRVVV